MLTITVSIARSRGRWEITVRFTTWPFEHDREGSRFPSLISKSAKKHQISAHLLKYIIANIMLHIRLKVALGGGQEYVLGRRVRSKCSMIDLWKRNL